MRQRLFFGFQLGDMCVESIFERIRLIDLVGHDIDLLHSVVDSVYANIQPDIEEMLVVGCIKQWRDNPAMLWALSFVNSAQGKDPSELYFKLDVAVLVEVPEDHICVFDRTITLGPFFQPVATSALIRVVS